MKSIKLFEEYISSIKKENSKVTPEISDEISDVDGSQESKSTETQNDGVNLVVITKKPKHGVGGEITELRNSAKKYDVNFFTIDVDKIKYSFDKSGNVTINGVGTFSKDKTVFMNRHGILSGFPEPTTTNMTKFNNSLLKSGFSVINDFNVRNLCIDKFKTFEALEKQKVDTIQTFYIDKSTGLDSIPKVKNFLKENKLELPVIVKVIDGSLGIGVFKCQDINILLSLLQYLVQKEGKCIIQPLCDIEYDLRVHVLCKSLYPDKAKLDDFIVIGSMKRDKAEDDFRTNFSIGGAISKYDKLTKDEIDLAKQATKAVGGVWCGIDICYDKITKKNYVIEVNTTPGLKGITQVADEKPTDIVLRHIKETLS